MWLNLTTTKQRRVERGLKWVQCINTCDCGRGTDEREGSKRKKKKDDLPPEDSLLIRLLLHLLIASHWGCREISVACHYACSSDFTFTQLAYRSTIHSGVCL